MNALPDDLAELLEAERDIDRPAPAQRQRMFARLEPLLILPAAIATATAASTAASASAASATAEAAASAVIGGALRAKLVAAVVSAAMIGGAVGAAGHAYYASHRPAPAVPAAAAAPTPKSTPAATAPIEPAPPPKPESSASAAAPATAVASTPRTEERTRSAGSLRAERLLIETASAALIRGDNASAILALKQHARSFPKGDLAQEREVLLVKALAASGDDAAAKRRAKDFKAKFPGSMQQGSVDKAARPE